MSTQYILVNSEVADKIQAFQRQLDELKSEYLEKIQLIPVDEELEDVRNCLMERLCGTHVFEIDEPEDTRFVIGTARSGRFQWRYENGFYNLFTVKRWMEHRPQFSIVDEYGVAVSLEEFTDLIKRYHDETV